MDTQRQRMPVIYLGHGAPPLIDDQLWSAQLRELAAKFPRPQSILVVSAHWETAPVALGATDGETPLVYDFYGFPSRYYELSYQPPGAPTLAAEVVAGLGGSSKVARLDRGLDHGAFIPLMVMYPNADIPVLQVSMPSLDPSELFDMGRRLGSLADKGVLIVASGFMTHGLGYVDFAAGPRAPAPGWSVEFDTWATEAVLSGQVDTLADFAHKAPGMPYAHPRADHFAPLFVAMGASTGSDVQTEVDGYWYGLAKRSFSFS